MLFPLFLIGYREVGRDGIGERFEGKLIGE